MMTETEHPFAHYVRTLARGKRARRDLTRDEARQAMSMMLDGRVEPVQVGAFLMSLRVKEETAQELAGFLDASREQISTLAANLPSVDLDWPTYAGKKKHPPWHLLAAWLLAQNGHRVLLHGGPEHTPGRLYADQVLIQWGWPVAASLDSLGAQLAAHNIGYAPLALFSPALHEMLALRHFLGLRSPINSLARGLNPAAAPVSLQSIFHPAYLELHAGAAQLCDPHTTIVIKGEGGDPEWRPDAANRLVNIAAGRRHDCQLDAEQPRATPPGAAVAPLDALWRADHATVARDDQLAYGQRAVLGTVALALMGLDGGDQPSAYRDTALSLWQARQRAELPFRPQS